MPLIHPLPAQSSRLYASNLYHLLNDLTPNKDGIANINMDDEVIRGMTVIKNGQITFPPPVVEVTAKKINKTDKTFVFVK